MLGACFQFAVADKLVESSASAEGLEATWP